jgi:Ca2+-binding RTX toxin-like protein
MKTWSSGSAAKSDSIADRYRRLILLLAVTFGVVLGSCVSAQPARSAGVFLTGSTITYSAEPGEDNNLLIKIAPDDLNLFKNADQEFIFTDSVGILDFDNNPPNQDSCQTISALAICPASEGTQLFVFLGDGNDHLRVCDPALNSFDQRFCQAPPPQPVYVCGGSGNDTLIGGPGGDRLVGGPGNDRIEGMGGNDLIAGTAGSFFPCGDNAGGVQDGDVLYGGEGDDVLLGGSGADSLFGDPGKDSLYGFEGDDSLDGGTGNDDLAGQDGNDSLYGGEGNDLIAGGSGSDWEVGGDGNDRLGETYVVDRAMASDTDPPADLVVTKDDGNDTMDGGPGDDLLSGEPAAGVTNGNSLREVEDMGPLPMVPDPNGSDIMNGGGGYDTVSYQNRSTPVALSLDGKANDGAPGEADRIGNDVEKLVGGAGDDALVGSAAAAALDGGPGSDHIDGGAGDDVLSGGEGGDTISGADGNDAINGGNGSDHLGGGEGSDTIAGGGGADSIDGAEGDDTLNGGPGGDVVLGGAGNDVIHGGDPLLPGADGPDTLDGGAGKDSLAGDDGDDLLVGGPGPDVLHGGAGVDTADYSAANSPVTITLDGQPNDGEPGENDNFGADVESASGGAENDFLAGDSRTNVLNGGSGDDFIEGGAGSDHLNGNDGNDAIDARDGVRDIANCGRGFDVAIVDEGDVVRDNCERVDRGHGTTAVGRSASVSRLRGNLFVRPRSMDRFIPLTGTMTLPVRSSVDARKGVAELSTRSRRGRRKVSVLRGALFAFDQIPSQSALTDARLSDASLRHCADRGNQASNKGQTLWIRSRGRVRVLGFAGYGIGRNATWTTTDRCDGTLVRVLQGKVRVFDRSRKRSFALRAGERHLAKR